MQFSLNSKFKSLDPFTISLPDLTILTGVNGAGKTQILSAIMDNKASVTENNSELNPKKYVTHQTLAPNDSSIVTRQSLLQDVDNIWNQYSSFQQNHKQNANYQLQQFIPDQAQIKLISNVASKTSKQISELSQEDIYIHYPVNIVTGDIFYQNFSTLFKRYQNKLDDNRYRSFLNEKYNRSHLNYQTDDEFIQEYGEAPWQFVNKILKEANLDYFINSPEGSDRDAPFELKLVNNLTSVEVEI
ncbi:MAG: hypothetical protein WKG07_17945 [Hymenobacter sp.]